MYLLIKGMHIEVESIANRSIRIANYILENRASMKQVAEEFGVSGPTISTAIHQKVKELDPVLYEKVKKVCDEVKLENRIKAGKISASIPKNNIKFGRRR